MPSMTLEEAIAQVRAAENRWRQTLTQHRLAPPDAGFPDRLADQADAARKAQAAYALAATIPGLVWTPLPPARRELPAELRPESARPGPGPLWETFDHTAQTLSDSWEGSSLEAIASAYGGLADALDSLAEPVIETYRRRGTATG